MHVCTEHQGIRRIFAYAAGSGNALRQASLPTTITSTSKVAPSRRTTSSTSTSGTARACSGAERSTKATSPSAATRVRSHLRGPASSALQPPITLSQSINSYFFRGSQQFGGLRLSGGLYDAQYSSFGNDLNWRLGLSRRHRLVERRSCFPWEPAFEHRCLPSATSQLGGQSLAGSKLRHLNGNPNERPEHATEYEPGFSHLFSSTSNVDVALYRSNLRDTIENFYPGGGAKSFCDTPLGYAYEIPINIGNAVYEGAEARYKQFFPQLNVTATLVRPQRRVPVRTRAERFQPNVGRYVSRRRAVSRRSPAARRGRLHLGAARLARLDGPDLCG